MNKKFLVLLNLIFYSIYIRGQVIVNGEEYKSECSEIILSSDTTDSLITSNDLLRKIGIKEGCLHLQLAYGGGCGKFYLEISWTGQVWESKIPQVPLELRCLDRDNCKALKLQDIYFDISRFMEFTNDDGIIFSVGEHGVSFKN